MSVGQYLPTFRAIVVPSSSVPVFDSLTLNMHNDPQKRIKLLAKDAQ
jgi:small neutral amino acid transporter SnatA (MarC family)